MKNGQTAGAAESRYVSYYPRPQAPSTVTSILLEAPGGGICVTIFEFICIQLILYLP